MASSTTASSSTNPPRLLVPARASAFTCVTDKTVRGGDTELQLLDVDGGGLQLQGSLGALEGRDGKLLAFAIASADVQDKASSSNNKDTSLLLSSTAGVHLNYRHTPPDLHYQLRVLTQSLPPQHSFVATLPAPLSPPTPLSPSASSFHKAMVPWTAFRLQFRGRALSQDEANAITRGAGVAAHSVTLTPAFGVVRNVGIEITRSSQATRWYSQVPLPFVFVLAAPGLDVARKDKEEVISKV